MASAKLVAKSRIGNSSTEKTSIRLTGRVTRFSFIQEARATNESRKASFSPNVSRVQVERPMIKDAAPQPPADVLRVYSLKQGKIESFQRHYLGDISFSIRHLKIEGWRLLQPLPVVLTFDEDNTVIISDLVFHEYGEGVTPAQARHDYELSLIEYHELLEDHIREDHPETERQLRHLQQYLKRL